VHVFQHPTVNVVVKPQSYVSHHKTHHKSDEVQITLNSTGGGQIKPKMTPTSHSPFYQIKIKTENKQKTTFEGATDDAFSEAPEIAINFTKLLTANSSNSSAISSQSSTRKDCKSKLPAEYVSPNSKKAKIDDKTDVAKKIVEDSRLKDKALCAPKELNGVWKRVSVDSVDVKMTIVENEVNNSVVDDDCKLMIDEDDTKPVPINSNGHLNVVNDSTISSDTSAACINDSYVNNTVSSDSSPALQLYVNSTLNIDAENSISSFSVSLKTRKCAPVQSWRTCGAPEKKLVSYDANAKPLWRECYASIKHEKNDIEISVLDCVMLRSSEYASRLGATYLPSDVSAFSLNSKAKFVSVASELSVATGNEALEARERLSDVFVAKVSAFWRDELTGKIMMELMWYYHPTQTDLLHKCEFNKRELFASKHYDVLDVDTIDDKCYVLTFSEYCRWKAREKCFLLFGDKKMSEAKSKRMPSLDTASDSIYFCRNAYDFRMKRLMRNQLK